MPLMVQIIDLHVFISATLHSLFAVSPCFVLRLFIRKVFDECGAEIPYSTILFRLWVEVI
jgi:hypothetical protein